MGTQYEGVPDPLYRGQVFEKVEEPVKPDVTVTVVISVLFWYTVVVPFRYTVVALPFFVTVTVTVCVLELLDCSELEDGPLFEVVVLLT
jgi:hypothetical protein